MAGDGVGWTVPRHRPRRTVATGALFVGLSALILLAAGHRWTCYPAGFLGWLPCALALVWHWSARHTDVPTVDRLVLAVSFAWCAFGLTLSWCSHRLDDAERAYWNAGPYAAEGFVTRTITGFPLPGVHMGPAGEFLPVAKGLFVLWGNAVLLTLFFWTCLLGCRPDRAAGAACLVCLFTTWLGQVAYAGWLLGLD